MACSTATAAVQLRKSHSSSRLTRAHRMSNVAEVLVSEKYGDHILSGMRTLLDGGLLCDLTLTAEDHTIEVHKVVMASSSDYFRALLTLDMKEKTQACIVLKGVPARGLKALVKFAYSGQLHCTLDNITDILLAATHLQLVEAINLCGNFLTSLTNKNNCVDMYNMADQFDLAPVKEKALNFVLTNFGDIAIREDFFKMSEKFLSKILADDRLKMSSELQLFELVIQWIKYDPGKRKKHVYLLMSHLRFPLISTHDLVHTVMAEPLMKVDTHCLELVLEANKYHMLPDQQPVMQSHRTQVRTDENSLVILDIDHEAPRVLNLKSLTWGSLSYTEMATYHAQACVLDNYMYVCGGIELYSSSSPVSGKCYHYDPRFDNWVSITSMQEPRHHFTLCADNKSLYAIGGFCNGTYKNVVEQFIVAENRWVYKCPMEVRLSAAASSVHGGNIYMSGGQTDRGITRCLWCYDTKVDKWYGKPPMGQSRMDHAMACYNNQLFVVGGYDKNIIKAFDVTTVECYDIETEQWSVVMESSPKLSSIYSCLIGHKMIVVGGFSYDDNKKKSEVSCYDIKTNQWSVVTRMHSPAMSVQCCTLRLPHSLFSNVTV